jgi:hypothetical protein
VGTPGEIRDLFIRLQSGTALTRQQIRDAWPGNLGPYVERLAGKLDRVPHSKLDEKSRPKLAEYITERAPKPIGRSISGSKMKGYYEIWRAGLPPGVAVTLDSRRAFDDSQKKQIFRAAKGHCVIRAFGSERAEHCAICEIEVDENEAEYDHFPIPHRDGGPTEVTNGRLVHVDCHPRGRPREELDE